MPKTMEMALAVATKTFLPRSPDTAMLFAPSGCTHPPPLVPQLAHLKLELFKDIHGDESPGGGGGGGGGGLFVSDCVKYKLATKVS